MTSDRIALSWQYSVGREKIREYATALGHREPWYFDPAAAREAGFRDVVAPPLFAVVFCQWMGPAILHPDSPIDYGRMLHGAQEFEFLETVCAGDVIRTAATLGEASHKGSLTFYVIESTSSNQEGREVVKGRWTMIVREA